MPSKRTGYAPWSLTREAGVQSATVEGTIEVPQNVQPTLSTGFVDEKGNWQGEKSSDETFFAFTKHLVVPNNEVVLAPATATVDHIDMTGFNHLSLGIKVTRTGSYALEAVMGPDTNSYANLSPVNAASTLRGSVPTPSASGQGSMNSLFNDGGETLTGDVWNIFTIREVLGNVKLIQLKITNEAGGNSDIEVAFMRLV